MCLNLSGGCQRQHSLTLQIFMPVLFPPQHTDEEYGEKVKPDGEHYGGPFDIQVSPTMRVEDLRKVIRDKGGIVPALQKLSYASKHLDDPQRTLEQCVCSGAETYCEGIEPTKAFDIMSHVVLPCCRYGVAYWHKTFPHWPLKIRRCA